MDKTERLITLLENKSDNERIDLLNLEIDRELALREEETDCCYIDRCVDMMIAIKRITVVNETADSVRKKAEELLDGFEKNRRQERVKKLSVCLKTFAKILAAAVLLLLLMGCTLYIVNRDAFYLLMRELGYESLEEMPRGNAGSKDVTVKRPLEEFYGKNAAEIKEKTGVDIWFPSYLPDGYILKDIFYTVFEDEKRISCNISPPGKIFFGATDLYKAVNGDLDRMEQEVKSGITFYFSAVETGTSTEYRALFNDGEFQYTVSSESREELYEIIRGIKKG